MSFRRRCYGLVLLSLLTVSAFVFTSAPAVAAECNPAKALTLLKQGQAQSVNGEKSKGVDTQVRAADTAWACYKDADLPAESRGKMGKASADILVGASQDADALGEGRAVTLAKLALSRYKILAKDRSLPLSVRVYADSAVQAATSP